MVKNIFDEAQPLLLQFADITLSEIPHGLSPLQDIPHHIDLFSAIILPNLPYYSKSPHEHAILLRRVD